jgi:hypothetical protein
VAEAVDRRRISGQRGDAKPWIVSLMHPTGFLAMFEIFAARSARKQWRAVLHKGWLTAALS